MTNEIKTLDEWEKQNAPRFKRSWDLRKRIGGAGLLDSPDRKPRNREEQLLWNEFRRDPVQPIITALNVGEKIEAAIEAKWPGGMGTVVLQSQEDLDALPKEWELLSGAHTMVVGRVVQYLCLP